MKIFDTPFDLFKEKKFSFLEGTINLFGKCGNNLKKRVT